MNDYGLGNIVKDARAAIVRDLGFTLKVDPLDRLKMEKIIENHIHQAIHQYVNTPKPPSEYKET